MSQKISVHYVFLYTNTHTKPHTGTFTVHTSTYTVHNCTEGRDFVKILQLKGPK